MIEIMKINRDRGISKGPTVAFRHVDGGGDDDEQVSVAIKLGQDQLVGREGLVQTLFAMSLEFNGP